MKTFYFAAFMPEPTGGYSIIIPDVPNCFTCAEDLNDGMEMAADVLRMVLEDMAGDKKAIPAPSDLETVKEKTKKHLQDIGYTIDGEILYQLIPAPSLDMVPVKISISLPRAVLEETDRKAKEYGYTRSGFLAHAVKNYDPHVQN